MQKVTIRVKGKIDESWAEWFEDFEIGYQGTRETVLTGLVADQAAFYGMIGKLRDLGLQILSVSSEEQHDQDVMQEG